SQVTHCDDDIINLDDEVASGDVQPSHLESKVACPLCSQLFTKDDIYVHASVCGESNTNEGDADISEDTDEHFGSVSDILRSLEKKVDTSRSFNINVTREDLFQRGLKQWARQKQASPKNLLRVSFIGENGIDQGALRKEFLTEMVCGIEARFFEGDGERGKNIKYSICDYQDNSFKTCGEIFATSLVQGGPAPNFLTRWCYHFLCHGEMDKDVGVLEVTDQDIKNLMTECHRFACTGEADPDLEPAA
uniref:HECT domain-containing protein n=1 Tax=Cyprinus carpio carpio TaxID=630221 RepID=A0A9J8DB00_CYPCA